MPARLPYSNTDSIARLRTPGGNTRLFSPLFSLMPSPAAKLRSLPSS